MRVAIDGPAGSGKSTVAHAISDRCGMTFLDTGAMYRAVTCECARLGIAVDDIEAVTRVAEECRIEFGMSDAGQTVFMNGRDVTREIRTPETDRNVSAVSAIPAVRAAMVERQRELGREGDVVAEGRDIGTVVFPDAEVKVFLTADPEARAHRRAVQRQGGDTAKDDATRTDADEERRILEDLKRRDQLDSSREASPLKPAEDAHHIDSSLLTVDEVVSRVIALHPRLGELERQASAAQAPEPARPAIEPKDDDAVAAPKAEAPKANAKREQGPMRPFAGNTHDDYYDHAIADWPITGRAFLWLVIMVVGALSKLLCPWRIEEAHKLWDDKSGRMLIMNHCSMVDPVILVVSAYMHGIKCRPIFKSEFNSNALTTWLFSRVGAIPVKRGTADIKAVRRAADALKRGECVLVFPEGTRIRDDERHEIHGGFSRMAQMAKAAVQPFAIVGARNIKPVGALLPRPFCPVYIKAGDKITFEELGVKRRKEQVETMERVAMDRVFQLRDELRAEHPGRL